MQKIDFSELAKISVTFNELLEFLKAIFVYCEIQREIKVKREHIRCQENELEKYINILQLLSIERNKMDRDLVDLRQQQTNDMSETLRIKSLLIETTKRLVCHLFCRDVIN